MKRNVYIAQVSVSHTDTLEYFPYAAGCLVAYAKSCADICEKYNICEIIHRRDNIEKVTERLDKPFLVGFSCEIWNMEYNKALASKIKEKYPDCIIVFGGHNVPFNTSILEQEKYVDVLIHGEGEYSFTQLLLAAQEGDYSAIPGVSYRKGNVCITNQAPCQCVQLDELPSPYITGVFDNMLTEQPNTEFHGIIETNRGCPYSCSFCNWCFSDAIRTFPIEKVKKELLWMAKHKIHYCYCADANFGILDRDKEIAAFVVEVNKKYGYPKIFKPTYAKNNTERVFEIGCLLNANGVDKGVTLSCQSVNPDVLDNIGRHNLDLEYFKLLTSKYAEKNIPTYTELILGLPGETYQSFCKGLCSLLDAGQHSDLPVYNCQLYCNAPLAKPENIEKYGIKWARQRMHGIHYPSDFNGIQEYCDVIIQTNTMNKADWVKANLFAYTLQCFHHLGLLQCFAFFAKAELNISFFDFYSSLLEYILSGSSNLLYSVYNEIQTKLNKCETSDLYYKNDLFGKIGWFFEEGIFYECILQIDRFFCEVSYFLDTLEIDKNIKQELLKYQKQIIRLPEQKQVCISSNYNFFSYFEAISCGRYIPLEKKKTRLQITPSIQIDKWDEYGKKIMLFGRKRNATLLTNAREKICIEYF